MFHQGQSFKPSASRENEISRLLDDARAGRLSYQRDPNREMPLGHAIAKNTTGADLAFGDAAMVYEGSYRHQGSWADWDMRRDHLLLHALGDVVSQPGVSTRFGTMAIAVEPIADNAFGRVAIAGLALVNGVPDLVAGNGDYRFCHPAAGNTLTFSYWGFARVLCWQVANNFTGDMSLVDLSDRKLQVHYVLTSSYSALSATATLDGGSGPWTTTVHDVHQIATFQRSGDKGFAEWRGNRWVVIIPFCT